MTTRLEVIDMHITRQAMHYSLNVLDSGAREAVLDYSEKQHGLSLYGDIAEIPFEDVRAGFEEFFGAGASIFLRRYNHFLGLSAEMQLALIGFMK